jgi:hypothetical protein
MKFTYIKRINDFRVLQTVELSRSVKKIWEGLKPDSKECFLKRKSGYVFKWPKFKKYKGIRKWEEGLITDSSLWCHLWAILTLFFHIFLTGPLSTEASRAACVYWCAIVKELTGIDNRNISEPFTCGVILTVMQTLILTACGQDVNWGSSAFTLK